MNQLKNKIGRFFTGRVLILVLLSMMAGRQAAAQDTAIAEWLCKSWKLKEYSENGRVAKPTKDQQHDRMIFYRDGQVRSIEAGKTIGGDWSYDEAGYILTITDRQSNGKLVFRVIKIDHHECVLQLQNGTENKMTITMAADEDHNNHQH